MRSWPLSRGYPERAISAAILKPRFLRSRPRNRTNILALKDTQGAQEFYFISNRIPINGIQNLSSPQFALKCPSLLLFVKQKRILSYTHDYFQKK